jgi:hypothetical protein
LKLVVFEFEVETISEAIDYINDYEKKQCTSVRCFEKEFGSRIIGGALKKLKT